ncbi:hypothetical protein D9757_003021 [Collybiopsis confluens]|uniref:Uncharacterized protein n=1 Tax=Collybiopsis confluens TaxID=2823264 RepID=A0A8H5ME63_9AGAR|nr:hypothetical protein D9757_003021 [Collybiopsis confluens]
MSSMSYDRNLLHPLHPALPPRRKAPKHRHATPSGPWPFLDLTDEVDQSQLIDPPPQPTFDDHEPTSSWQNYPASKFPNWTLSQQTKSGLAKLINRRHPMPESCKVYSLDISAEEDHVVFHADTLEGKVVKSGPLAAQAVRESTDSFWNALSEKAPPETRVRALFVDNLNGPVLQMLGSKFHIEPFFFTSSVNSIPSRYQEQVRPGQGDHVTLILSFIRSLPSSSSAFPSPNSSFMSNDVLQSSFQMQAPIIDIEAPLVLQSDPSKLLVLDILSLHVIRKKYAPSSESESDPTSGATPPLNRQESGQSTFQSPSAGGISTIISYHSPSQPPFSTTSADFLHKRLLSAGRSVYWSNIFSSTVPSGDPTFVTLSLLWIALYSWDETMDILLREVAFLEAETLSALPNSNSDDREDAHARTLILTHQLHVVRAHLLNYESLLEDFRKTVDFLLKTVNPGLVRPWNAFSSPSRVGTMPGAGAGAGGGGGSGSGSGDESETDGSRTGARPRGSSVTAGPSQYPQNLRSMLPRRAGEAPTIAVAARDALGHVMFREEEAEQAALFNNMNNMTRDSLSTLSSGSTADTAAPLRPKLNMDTNAGRESRDLESESYERLLDKEGKNLLNGIDRLEMTRDMLNNRLGNVMELVMRGGGHETKRSDKKLFYVQAFNSINIEDSRRMKNLAEAAGRDSAVMKQISWITMIFLPASFIAAVFGMNVKELVDDAHGEISHFLEAVIPLTAVTVYIMMLQYGVNKRRSQSKLVPLDVLSFVRVAPMSVWRRVWNVLGWPMQVFMSELSPWNWSSRSESGSNVDTKKTNNASDQWELLVARAGAVAVGGRLGYHLVLGRVWGQRFDKR